MMYQRYEDTENSSQSKNIDLLMSLFLFRIDIFERKLCHWKFFSDEELQKIKWIKRRGSDD